MIQNGLNVISYYIPKIKLVLILLIAFRNKTKET